MNQNLAMLDQPWTSSHPFFLYLVLFFIFLLIVLWFSKPHKHIKHNLPPSPWRLPILGNLHQLHHPPHLALHSLAKTHGPLMLLRLGQVSTLIVSSAEMAQEIMKTHDHAFSSRPKSSIANRLLYGKDIAFAPYGEYWRQVRKICVLQLLSMKKVQWFRDVREEEVVFMVEKIKELSYSSSVVNLSEMFILLTNSVVSRIALGRKYGEVRFKEILEEFSSLLGTFNIGDLVPSVAWVNKLSGLNARVDKNFYQLDSFLDEVVEQHIDKNKKTGLGEGQEKDFVDVLLEIEKDMSLGITIARDNIKAIIMDMFAAGTDTASVVLEWAMSELVKHQEIMKEVQEEVRRVARGKPILTENDDIDSMHYLKSVIKETLRLHPPLPLLVPRESTEETKIQGYEIPEKTTVFINAHAVGRDPKAWEEPEKFCPKRFMSVSGSLIDFKGQDFHLIPFGAGRRGCPGTNFAIVLIELALANLLNMFDWVLPDGVECKHLNMDEGYGISIHRKTSLAVNATLHYS